MEKQGFASGLKGFGLVGVGVAFGLGSAFLMTDQRVDGSAPLSVQTDVEVTRQQADPLTLSTISTLQSVVANSQTELSRTDDLSPEQLEVVAFFELSARQLNESVKSERGQLLHFDNMTIDKLNVRYYYTYNSRYDQIDREAALAEQARLVYDNICSDTAIRTLMDEYGLNYTYRYISSDFRHVGEVNGSIESCAS